MPYNDPQSGEKWRSFFMGNLIWIVDRNETGIVAYRGSISGKARRRTPASTFLRTCPGATSGEVWRTPVGTFIRTCEYVSGAEN